MTELERAIAAQYGGYNPGRKRRFGISAFKAGWQAAKEGKSSLACPYEDKRTRHGSVTFSRAYIRVWRDGWAAYQKCVECAL